MGFGDHPQRTPLYGAALMIGVMLVGTIITTAQVSAAVRIPLYVLLVVVGIVGAVLTFRDYS